MSATNLSSLVLNGDTPGIFPAGPTGAPTMGDPVNATRLVIVQATAVASQTIAIPLPLGARIVYTQVNQRVAPTGATATMALGSTSGASDIIAATDVKTNLQTQPSLSLIGTNQLVVANFASISATSAGGSIVYLTLAQTTPTAVGTWFVQIDYEMV
jgi:hypothetical protein